MLPLSSLPFPAALFADADGRLLQANEPFRRAFAREGIGTRAELEAQLTRLPPAPEAAAPDGAELVLARGSRRWYALYREAVDGDAELWIATDESGRMEALKSHRIHQDRLLFTSRLMSVGEMAATLAHELNQPLAAIGNYLSGANRLLERAGGPAPVISALEAARHQADHASAVIGRMREFVRQREPARDVLRVPALVDAVMRLLQLEAEKHRVRVRIDVDRDLPGVYADRVMIEQVLLNLVKNAIEAMRETEPERREVTVSARVDLDGMVELRVRDRGCGLGDGEDEQVFSPFFTTKADGLGIGLAICRSIIEYHEGRLYHERPDGGGCVFAFTLPQAVGEPVDEAAEDDGGSP